MNELLSRTSNLSEGSQSTMRLNPPSAIIQNTSEECIDLTTDSPPHSFSLPSLRRYPDPNLPSASLSSPEYFTFYDMPPTAARKSKEPTVSIQPPAKRRRGNGFDNLLNSISPEPRSCALSQVDSIDFLDLTTPQKDTFTTTGTLKRKASEELVSRHEQDIDLSETQTVQDKHLSDTIKAQAGISQATSKLNQLTCIICMDNMENMTATICGKSQMEIYLTINLLLLTSPQRSCVLSYVYHGSSFSWRESCGRTTNAKVSYVQDKAPQESHQGCT